MLNKLIPIVGLLLCSCGIATQATSIASFEHKLPADVSEEDLFALIDRLNADASVHGILCQFPVPDHLDERAVVARIDPAKDVDGFHPYTLGRLTQRWPLLRPCTPKGIIRLIEHTNREITGISLSERPTSE